MRDTKGRGEPCDRIPSRAMSWNPATRSVRDFTPRRSRRKRLAFSIAFTFVLLILAELAGSRFLPGVRTRTEILTNFGGVYPAAFSDYLPFTTPAGMTVTGQPDIYSFGRIEFNALGYRGPDPVSIEKPSGRRRLLLLGDSFMLGWGVPEEQTIAGIIRDRWQTRAPFYEVINAGYRDGYSPDSYYAYLKREGLDLKPDLVAVEIFTFNDIADASTNVWHSVDELGGPTSLSTIRLYTDYRGGLLDRRLLPWPYRVPVLSNSRLFVAAGSAISKTVGVDTQFHEGNHASAASLEEGWRRFETSITAMSRLCESRGIPLVFVALPLIGKAPSEDVYFEPIQKLMQDRVRRPYLPLHELLNVANHQLPNDAHTNAAGNRVIADAILTLLAPYLEGNRSSR